MKKFLSRKLVVTCVFGIAVPVLFHSFGIPESITMLGMGIGAAYLGANAVAARRGVE